jgi:hypothetical protein
LLSIPDWIEPWSKKFNVKVIGTKLEVSENKIMLHYFSTRQGLTDFMFGLIQGLGEFYNTPISIIMAADRRNGDEHDIYEINIIQ